MNKLFGILLIGILCFAGCSVFAAEIIQDELVKEFLLDKQIEKPEPFLNYNYENTDVVEIKLAIVDAIKSENDIYENQPVKFRVLSDVHYKGRVIIKRNTIVPAKVDVIIRSGMNGIPASIIFGNFEFEGINKHLISDTYEVRGQDRSLARARISPQQTHTVFVARKQETGQHIHRFMLPSSDREREFPFNKPH